MRIPMGAIAIFFVSMAIGTFLIWSPKSNQYTYLVPKIDERVPASVRESLSALELPSEPMRVPIPEQFWSHVWVDQVDGQFEYQFSQFAAQDSMGRDNLACLVYDRVRIEFIAEGQAVSGEKPRLVVESPCRIQGGDVLRMNAVRIPASELQESPLTGEPIEIEGNDALFEVIGAADEWPRYWLLKKVDFFQSANPEFSTSFSLDFQNPEAQSRAERYQMIW